MRVLILGGLQVGGFSAHARSSQVLDCPDLTEAAWRHWLRDVVAGQGRIRALTIKTAGKGSPPSAADRAEVLRLADPAALWSGSAATAQLLADEWKRHRVGSTGWLRDEVESQRRIDRAAHRLLWKNMSRFRDRLPPLSFFWVQYPAPAVFIVPPDSVVISSLADENIGARIAAFVQAAEALQAAI